MSTPEERQAIEQLELFLLKGVRHDLNKMTKDELKTEATLWRTIWSWIPDEVRYYVSRTSRAASFPEPKEIYIYTLQRVVEQAYPRANRATHRSNWA